MNSKESAEVFTRFLLNTKQTRLETGLARREYLRDRIDAGETPTDDYRYKWLQKSSFEIIGHLRNIAEKFNCAHPDDLISSWDLIDVLNIAVNRIKKKMEE